MAACGTSPPEKSQTVPDHFDDNLSLLMRSVAHPCGADADVDGDGAVDVHWSYSYDGHGRSDHDVAKDLTGALYEQIDYAWDHAGHLINQHDVQPASITSDEASVYDTLGRRIQIRQLLSDSDPTDDTSTVHMRSTIDYSGFDELGHSAHGDQLSEDLDKGTSETRTRDYGYDELGRRISLEVRFASGDVFQRWQHAYDDIAHTVTSQLHEPVTPSGGPGFTDSYVDTYDAEGHWLSRHSVITYAGSARNDVQDTVARWDGDRQLDETFTATFSSSTGEVYKSGNSIRFKYDCD